MQQAVIFAIGMLASAIVGRVTTLAVRGRVSRPLNGWNAAKDAVGLVAGLCFWVLILWGFSALDWYVALPVILVAGLVGGVVANPPRFAFFHRFELIFDLATLAITAWLWVEFWPY